MKAKLYSSLFLLFTVACGGHTPKTEKRCAWRQPNNNEISCSCDHPNRYEDFKENFSKCNVIFTKQLNFEEVYQAYFESEGNINSEKESKLTIEDEKRLKDQGYKVLLTIPSGVKAYRHMGNTLTLVRDIVKEKKSSLQNPFSNGEAEQTQNASLDHISEDNNKVSKCEKILDDAPENYVYGYALTIQNNQCKEGIKFSEDYKIYDKNFEINDHVPNPVASLSLNPTMRDVSPEILKFMLIIKREAKTQTPREQTGDFSLGQAQCHFKGDLNTFDETNVERVELKQVLNNTIFELSFSTHPAVLNITCEQSTPIFLSNAPWSWVINSNKSAVMIFQQ